MKCVMQNHKHITLNYNAKYTKLPYIKTKLANSILATIVVTKVGLSPHFYICIHFVPVIVISFVVCGRKFAFNNCTYNAVLIIKTGNYIMKSIM